MSTEPELTHKPQASGVFLFFKDFILTALVFGITDVVIYYYIFEKDIQPGRIAVKCLVMGLFLATYTLTRRRRINRKSS